METKNAVLAGEYYRLVGEKNAKEVEKLLHSDVEFHGPLATLKGKEAVIKATSNFMKMFKSLTIRAKFGAKDQAMVVYDVDIPGMSEAFPGASLLTIKGGRVARIELFYDGSRFIEKKEEVFS
jgi:ketosteroid isomerase-like protein